MGCLSCFVPYPSAMALIAVTATEKVEALKNASSDLQFMFDKKGVDEDTRIRFYHIGVTSVELLSVVAKDQGDLEALLETNFGLDPKDLPSRIKASKVVTAWMAAKTRSAKQAELDGECEARKIPKDIGTSDIAAMRKAFETAWWELEDSLTPSKSYLEKKLDEVEKDDLRAELLSEVLAVPEDDPDTLKTIWTSSHELRAVRVGSKVSLPRDTEEFRKRITLLGTAWLFVSYQQTHKRYFSGLTPQVFNEYLSYMLGEHVLGLTAKDSGNRSFAAPPWPLLLSYEHAVRSKAMMLIRKGSTFKDALKAAWEDPIVKERHFTTPLCLETGGRKRPADNYPDEHRKENAKHQKVGSKGSGKGKSGKGKPGKGKTRGGKTTGGCARATPDGKNICFAFNDVSGCNKTGCQFLHACGVCFAKGKTMQTCTHG